jgi:hypothetical protein
MNYFGRDDKNEVYPELMNELPMEESQTMCDKCRCIPNQYITLVCDHNICLICLAVRYLQMKRTSPQSLEEPVIIPCELCSNGTVLEQGTIDAIECVLVQHSTGEPMQERLVKLDSEYEFNDCESKPTSNNQEDFDGPLERGFM